MKILMVCLGNICRSPMAEGVMRYTLLQKGINGVEVDSCGTSAYHSGEAPDVRAQKECKHRGVDISYQRSRTFSIADFKKFDKIYTMDVSNFEHIMTLAQNAQEKGKVKMIMNEAYPSEDIDVPDPYYGGEKGFQNVFDMLVIATEAIAAKHC